MHDGQPLIHPLFHTSIIILTTLGWEDCFTLESSFEAVAIAPGHSNGVYISESQVQILLELVAGPN